MKNNAEKAAGVEEIEQALFETQKKIYPRAISGYYANLRWFMVWFTQILFYGTAWLTWNDRQAVLFDLAARKFYIFGLVFWPQDFIYLAVLLIISALLLFLVTAVAGRVFCGYACPQSVYTEIFMWIERKIEGDRSARIKLDGNALSARKILLKTAKHAAWIAVALWTGFTFVGYFTPIHTLSQEVFNLSLGPWQLFWILFYALATYGNAGWMREQVCKYMCPYARFQSAMFDKDTLTVTYDASRGEPRGARGKKSDYKAQGLGTCVDCNICVQVCPTGIDIRNGLQYECIGCALCVDACDQVMDKMEYPKGLIRYTTEHALTEKLDHKGILQRMLRPRILIYTGILALVILMTALSVALRSPLKFDVIRDRGLPRVTENGSIDNVYRLQIMNTDENPRRYVIEVKGIPGVTIVSDAEFEMPAATTRFIPARIRVPAGVAKKGSNKITFIVRDRDNEQLSVAEKAAFLIPR
ncbi:MAG: cytochrome c oxidase accessory protein CcoG [Gallionellales bacterium 35-53-114]|jgi:cytochrome c oxidase accessory protein FixG|nr:MAG: cytochrome c oxidase accessory protein CcoG [Gallionellales bacterium 35-53-114]OYZ62147.1 MAG: cytochrome c oxidase accessory protein CcoG [Gallionellales bacterium 24-53-125]OZB07291.1 MAG: cytochrome c oxidase accessory protein CcoG [Gallionellales bacterium 39-52-133]HQS59864.1 cytochrome c oxidase accessory protein CcoG [Gallionellaceae bacterium]HQS76618.1 cytochrome c oxidase accessory protein CcoG [Gallionellaceae bacterium]